VLDFVTVSVGIAAYPENALTVEELVRTADGCLYESKAIPAWHGSSEVHNSANLPGA
jgi:GGDEF domain-containing protein